MAYSIGLVLDALTAAGTDWFFIWITWCPLDNDELNRILKFLDKDKDERKPRGFLNGFFRYGSWRIPGLLRTRIRQLDTDAKMIVPKLVAEEFLLRNTAPGLLLVYLAGMLRIKTQWAPMAIVLNNNQDIFTLLGLFAVPLLIASYHRARRTLRRTIELVQFLQMGPAGSQRTDQPEALGLSKAART